MLTATDFSIGNSHSKGKTTIWGNSDIFVMVNYDVHEGKESEFLSAAIDFINHRLEWIENNKPLLENMLMENHIVDQTEEWIRKANYAKEIVKDASYALRDGQEVTLPLAKDAFLSGLSVSGMEIDYQSDEQKPRTDLYIHCDPDYFCDGACIQVEINHDDTIAECGILSEYSPNKPWRT